MKIRFALLSALIVSVLMVIPVLAHQETHKGTVLAVEKTGVRVNVVDPRTKNTEPRSFEIDKETKILRDDAVVTLATVKFQKNEAIAVTVDHDLDENLALVIRVGTAK